MQLPLKKLQTITNYDKLLCKSLCYSPRNQFQTQIDQGPGWRRGWAPNNCVNKSNGKTAKDE